MALKDTLTRIKEYFMAQTVTAAFTQSLDSEVGSIVFMPEGKHSITASVDGRAKTVDVEVDSRVLASFQEDLEKRKESNVRPFAGFDHKTGAASFIPLEFRYEDGVGLVLDIEWTKAGREAVEGKDYSYFSPSFLMKDGIPLGLPKRGEVGSLVNDPAFEDIPRIAASNNQPQSEMENLVELGLCSPDTKEEEAMVEAKSHLDALKVALEEAKAQVAAMSEDKVEADQSSDEADEELATLQAQKKELEEQNEALKQQMSDNAEKTAEAAIAEAVSAGRIAPKDEAAKDFWKKAISADPEAAKVLASQPANKAVEGETIIAGRSSGREMSKEIARSDFDELTPGAKLEFVKAGGAIQDNASE